MAVLSLASSKTQEHDWPCNGWTLDEIAATILNEAHAQSISSTPLGLSTGFSPLAATTLVAESLRASMPQRMTPP